MIRHLTAFAVCVIIVACQGPLPYSTIPELGFQGSQTEQWKVIDRSLGGGTLTMTSSGRNETVTTLNIDNLAQRLMPELHYIAGKALEHGRTSTDPDLEIGGGWQGLVEISGSFSSDSSQGAYGLRVTTAADFSATFHNYSGRSADILGYTVEDTLYLGGRLHYRAVFTSSLTGTIHFAGAYRGRIVFNEFNIGQLSSSGIPYKGEVLVESDQASFFYYLYRH
ncbi:MAG: hypothetical protein FVQ81_12710 [Candidatus Glassbacteria bacterium]|nr:hypothetical protein [Candidatus Glassbacteria bacterium]